MTQCFLRALSNSKNGEFICKCGFNLDGPHYPFHQRMGYTVSPISSRPSSWSVLSLPTQVLQPKILMILDSNCIPPPPAFLHPLPASCPVSHLTFQTGHYVSGLISLQCIGAAKGLSLTRIESSHVFLLVCEIKPHLQPTSLSLPVPFTPACDSSPPYPSFIAAICQALSCPRVFLDSPLCRKKSSLVHSAQGLLQAVCVPMHVDMCPRIREKFVFHMEMERILLIWEEPALSMNGSSAWHAVLGPSHLPPLSLPSSL